MELGLKAWRKLLRKKIILLPLDLTLENLGLTPQIEQELIENLNVIINAAGTVEFDTRLDLATDVNVRGPLLLMKLAERCKRFECFA